ncbi:MAG: serine/threonine protein kinase [Bacteroidetes bacterium]|nr:serine/threonine protein kinase [Bacteroidota bacterium]
MIVKSGSIFYDGKKNEYEVIEFLGNGSFGDVYKINHKSKNKVFALKTIQSPFVSDNVLNSFINEGGLSQKVSHKNVIKYYYFHDGLLYPELPLYIIMEYANGGTLDDKINERKINSDFFSNSELLKMFNQLCDGMNAINNSLIHRDIKPDNILFDGNTLKISDFGLSKIVTESTRTSTFKGIGCLPFMAPEGWRFEKNTIQMDIYSMGFVFYELACLSHPFTITKGDYTEWQEAHFYQNPKSPKTTNTELSNVFVNTIFKMIEKKASQRFTNWEDIKNNLAKESLPNSQDSPLIESIISRKSDENQAATEARLKREKREEEIKSLKKLVKYQLKNEIVEPIEIFINELKQKSDGITINIKEGGHDLHYIITNNYSQIIIIELDVIIEEKFWKEFEVSDFGRSFIKRELRVPKLYNRNIVAWGHVKANDQRGFNLVLLENPNDIYGEWYTSFNTNSALVRSERIEPFAFEFSEIEREIQITGMHIYVKSISQLSVDRIKEFISNYI